MKKICFLIGGYNNSGGTERVTSQIANGLVDRGYDISIVSIERGLKPHYHTDKRICLYELDQSDKYELGNSTLIDKLKFRFWSAKKISNIKKSFCGVISKILPDVVVAVDIECYRIIDAFRGRYGYKTIAWEHFSLLTRNSLGVNYSRYLASNHAAKLIVLSDNDLIDYKRKYPRAKNLMRMHNPLAFQPKRDADMKNKVVIAAGRYVPQKGFDLLIDAWSRISIDTSEWELRIYGDGADRDKLEKLLLNKQLTNVKLLPYANDLAKEMTKASIYALSSRFEGWGLVLIEAQAIGLPCVSFDCKHGPSEIIDNGVNGFLVPQEDVDMLAHKLSVLIADESLRKDFSDKSQKDLYRFEINNIINQWEKLLLSI